MEVVKGQHEESFSDGNILCHSCIDCDTTLLFCKMLVIGGTGLKVTWHLSVLFITMACESTVIQNEKFS